MEKEIKRTGLFLALVFLIGAILVVIQVLVQYKATALEAVTHKNVLICLLFSLVFLLSARIKIMAWAQPILFFAATPTNLLASHDSFYGLGFFVIGLLLLFRLGFFETKRAVKLLLVLSYLFGWEFYAGIKSGRSLVYAFTPIFFLAAFLLMLYLAYKEKLMVYLKEPKPKLSLDEKGLSPAEKTYVMAVLSGKNHKEIAIDYEISDSTVRNTVSRAYQKLEVSDKAGLAVLAERFEIVV